MKEPGHHCQQPGPANAEHLDNPPPPLPQLQPQNGDYPPPPPRLQRANAVGGHLPFGNPQVLPPGGINYQKFKHKKSKKLLRKSKPKKSKSRKYNRRV